MTDQRVNIPLLRKAVEWAEAEAAKPPELCEWKQDSYYLEQQYVAGADRAPECGACFCIAGYIASLVRQPEGCATDSADVAAEALGLSTLDAWPLFGSDNTIADVRRIAEDMAGERL